MTPEGQNPACSFAQAGCAGGAPRAEMVSRRLRGAGAPSPHCPGVRRKRCIGMVSDLVQIRKPRQFALAPAPLIGLRILPQDVLCRAPVFAT